MKNGDTEAGISVFFFRISKTEISIDIPSLFAILYLQFSFNLCNSRSIS